MARRTRRARRGVIESGASAGNRPRPPARPRPRLPPFSSILRNCPPTAGLQSRACARLFSRTSTLFLKKGCSMAIALPASLKIPPRRDARTSAASDTERESPSFHLARKGAARFQPPNHPAREAPLSIARLDTAEESGAFARRTFGGWKSAAPLRAIDWQVSSLGL